LKIWVIRGEILGIAERRQREKEQRKIDILDAAEHLFFSRGYEDVSMDEIAREVELNKATIYLYFKNKETLFAGIVLRGIRILQEKYMECIEKKVPGIVRIALMGQAYYLFSLDYPDYIRMIQFYSSERFSNENPCSPEIGKGYGTCRMLLKDAIQEGINDGTIRADLDPFLTSMYLMTSFMSILSMENKWKLVIEAEGFSYEQFTRDFFRFIIPAIVSKEYCQNMSVKDLESYGFFSTDPVIPDKKRVE